MNEQKHASLETGHLYGTDIPFGGSGFEADIDQVKNHEFLFEMQVAKKIEEFLRQESLSVSRIWFHDDIIPRMQQIDSQDPQRWELFIQRTREQVIQYLEKDGYINATHQSSRELGIWGEGENLFAELIQKYRSGESDIQGFVARHGDGTVDSILTYNGKKYFFRDIDIDKIPPRSNIDENLDIYSEFSLIQEARDTSIPEIISASENNPQWNYHTEKKTLVGPRIKKGGKKYSQNIRLLGYRHWQDIPSCEVLDYTLYKKRLQKSSPTITLISESMKSQQSKVRRLFEISAISPEIIILFHNGEKITHGEYWGIGENQYILDSILEQDF